MKDFNQEFQLFSDACHANDIEAATKLLQIKEVENAVDAQDNALFINMLHKGHLEIIKLLLTIDKIKAFASSQFSPAFEYGEKSGYPIVDLLVFDTFLNACYNNNVELAKKLAKNEAVIKLSPASIPKLYESVIRSGHTEIIALLLEMGNIAEDPKIDYKKLIEIAIDNNQPDILKLLLSKRKTFDFPLDGLIMLEFKTACKKNNIHQAQVLAEQEVVPQFFSIPFLEENIPYADIEIIKILLNIPSIREKADANNNRALILAVESGRDDVARLLFSIEKVRESAYKKYGNEFKMGEQKGFDEVDTLTLQKFKDACLTSNIKTAINLLGNDAVMKYCANFDPAMLHKIVNRGKNKILRLLIGVGNVNDILDANDNQLLNMAIEEGNAEVAQLLMKVQNVRNLAFKRLIPTYMDRLRAGYSEIDMLYIDAFQRACAHNNVDLANKLLTQNAVKKFCASLDKDFFKEVMLHGHTEIIRHLISLSPYNADRAFLVACENGYTHMVKFLLEIPSINEHAADYGNQALRAAIENDHVEIVKLLLDVEHIREQSAVLPPWTLSKILSLLYSTDISILSEAIFVDESETTPKEEIEPISANPFIVYNNTHYTTAEGGYPGTYEKGSPLYLDAEKTTPIGYNIHLPPQGVKIKSVIVEVYGGHEAKERENKAYKPGALDSKDAHLVNNGTVVVTLNLPDLLKLNAYQSEIDETLHQEIHDAIHQFYQTLKYSPETLHESLKAYRFEDLDMFLYGASFGGRTAIRHAELYPHTFNGYISHDGYLSFEMAQKADLISRPLYTKHLDPSLDTEIQKISEPVLLLHNMDDNNVNAKVTLDFYKKLVKNGKSDLARTCITMRGNPMSSHRTANKGHFVPAGKEDFARYTGSMLNFMNKGPSALPSITTWRGLRYDKLANKFYQSGTLQQQFIAEIHHRARLDRQEAKRLKDFSDGSHDIWEQNYQPLFYAMHYAQKLAHEPKDLVLEILRFDLHDLLTDEVIENALRLQSGIFSQYLQEEYGIAISNEELAKSPEMINMFRKMIFSLDKQKPSVAQFMLNALYQANPALLSTYYPNFEQDAQLQQNANEAKAKLVKVVAKERRMIQHAWQQLSSLSLKQSQIKKMIHQMEALKNPPYSMDKKVYIECLHLSERNTNSTKDMINKINEIIHHFEVLNSSDETAVMNLIYAKLTKAILTQDSGFIEKTKKEAIDILLKLKCHDEDKKNHEVICKEIIDDNFAELNGDKSHSKRAMKGG